MSTIDDLPPEVLEMITPDMMPNTITILRQVSTKFYSVFSADRFYENFLYRPEKEHKALFKSERKGEGVKQVIESIANNELGRWKGYVELKKVHFRNWRSGTLESFDNLPFPPGVDLSTSLQVDELVDDQHEHWILCNIFGSSVPRSLRVFLFNATGKPKLIGSLNLLNVEITFGARLFPGKIIVAARLLGLYNIYNIARSTRGYELKFLFCIAGSSEAADPRSAIYTSELNYTLDSAVITGKGRSGNPTILVIASHRDQRATLHVWDVTTGTKIRTFSLRDSDIWNNFIMRFGGASLIIRQGEFPHVIIRLSHAQANSVQITLFNVVNNQVTLVDEKVTEKRSLGCATNMWSNYLVYNNLSYSDGFVLYKVDQTRVRPLIKSKEKRLTNFVVGFRDKHLITFSENTKKLTVRVHKLDKTVVAEGSFIIMKKGELNFIAFIDPNLLVFLDRGYVWIVFDVTGHKQFSKELDEELLKPLRAGWPHSEPEVVYRSTTRSYLFLTKDRKSMRLYYF